MFERFGAFGADVVFIFEQFSAFGADFVCISERIVFLNFLFLYACRLLRPFGADHKAGCQLHRPPPPFFGSQVYE